MLTYRIIVPIKAVGRWPQSRFLPVGAILARREDEDQGRAGPKGSRVASIRPHHLVDWLPKLFGDRIASVVVVDSSNRTLAIVPERLSIMALAVRGVAMLRPT